MNESVSVRATAGQWIKTCSFSGLLPFRTILGLCHNIFFPRAVGDCRITFPNPKLISIPKLNQNCIKNNVVTNYPTNKKVAVSARPVPTIMGLPLFWEVSQHC